MGYFDFPHTRTYDSDLGWLIKTVKTIADLVEGLEDWKTEHVEEYEQLKALYDAIMSGNFPESVTDAFQRWMNENALDLVGEMAKLVFFGINDAGYWVAYIPEGWDDIIFNTTGYDINIPDYPEYGRLVLSFLVGGH